MPHGAACDEGPQASTHGGKYVTADAITSADLDYILFHRGNDGTIFLGFTVYVRKKKETGPLTTARGARAPQSLNRTGAARMGVAAACDSRGP
jgi:hypothetical protein